MWDKNLPKFKADHLPPKYPGEVKVIYHTKKNLFQIISH